MNSRERFLAVMNFEPVDRTMMWDIGYWSDSVRRWHREGLPHRYEVPESVVGGSTIRGSMNGSKPYWSTKEEPATDQDVVFAVAQEIYDYFGLDQCMVHIPVHYWIYPAFEQVILEEDGDCVLVRDSVGIVKRERRDHKSLPHWLRGPVSNWEDWEQVKAERLQPHTPGRVPEDWPKLVEEYRHRDYVLSAGGCPGGFYGGARHLLGEQLVLTTFIDNPALMHAIMDHLADMWIELYDRVLDDVHLDCFFIWEDMCYKNGPLISPAMFREFMLPNYKRFTACLRDHGVKQIMVDTDGDARSLVPLFAEGGVSIMYPLEPPHGMDVVALAKAHPKMRFMGGIDKRKLAVGPAAIDEELERKVPFMLKRGGYVPYLDHQAPPDISWENFKYFRQKLNAMIQGKGY